MVTGSPIRMCARWQASIPLDHARAARGLELLAQMDRFLMRERADLGAIKHALAAKVLFAEDRRVAAEHARILGLDVAERGARLFLRLLRAHLNVIAAASGVFCRRKRARAHRRSGRN